LVWIDLGDAAEVLTILRTRCGPVHGSGWDQGNFNYDGLINAADFTILAANFNQPVTGWDQGDFNYDGQVNAADFTDLAANFNQSTSGADVSGGDVAALDAFAAANGLSLPTSSVPEPASAGMMVMAGCGILARRRRRSLPA
jgi:hypothetical protein